MKILSIFCISAMLLPLFFCERQGESQIFPTDLSCEYLVNPLGIDETHPRLSWKLHSNEGGAIQTAYRILVASSRGKLERNQGDLWDSGKIRLEQSVHVAYMGRPLTSRQSCYWKVKVWDKEGNSSWSEPAYWTIGLLKLSDWQAKWIQTPRIYSWPELIAGYGRMSKSAPHRRYEPAPCLRKSWFTEKTVKKATVYITGLGYYELFLNGIKIGDHVLDPAFTNYDKRILYVTYDVTGSIIRGKNAIGVILGDGWYNMHSRAV
jgi:alpha-L-rhamnosidase